MATWKLVAVYVVWLLASAAIALTAGLLVAAIATSFGVEAGSPGQRRITETVAVVGFIVLAATPFLLRRRIDRSEPQPPA